MIYLLFFAFLAAAWLALTLTAFCPLRAWRRRQLRRELEAEGFSGDD